VAVTGHKMIVFPHFRQDTLQSGYNQLRSTEVACRACAGVKMTSSSTVMLLQLQLTKFSHTC
jgi:hypothetical protein